MKSLIPSLVVAGLLAAGPSSQAVILLSQNFDTDPVNYITNLPFDHQGTKYFNLSSNLGADLNPAITGNATTYLTGQNMDGTLNFSTTFPAQVDFTQSTVGFAGLSLQIDLAGLPTAEPNDNFLRALLDVDGDTFYETTLFNFTPLVNNSAYVDPILGQLGPQFQTFGANPTDIAIQQPIDNILRLRIEFYNDTDSLNEAQGIDNIIVNAAVPEPTASLLLLTGLAAFVRRRR